MGGETAAYLTKLKEQTKTFPAASINWACYQQQSYLLGD